MTKEQLVSLGLSDAHADLVAAESVKELDEYVSKEVYQTAIQERDMLSEDIITHKDAIDKVKLDYALELDLIIAGVRNLKAVKALLPLEDLKIGEDGKITGISEIIGQIKKSDAYLFNDQKQEAQTGGAFSNARQERAPQTPNPWATNSFDLTAQGKMLKENPEQAKAFMAQADAFIK